MPQRFKETKNHKAVDLWNLCVLESLWHYSVNNGIQRVDYISLFLIKLIKDSLYFSLMEIR